MAGARHPRYAAHARRAEALRRVSAEPLASYWAGYRLGMVRTLREDRAAATGEERARDHRTAAALRGERDGSLADYARWCGHHDGQQWADVTQHRGLLRLAIAATGRSVRAFALDVLGIDDASLRQMLAGTRPVPATRHSELLDLVADAMA